MNDRANGATVERKRERIGLSLASDVADILWKHGRDSKATSCFKCGMRPVDHIGEEGHLFATDPRPTRTEIIEEAVREWRQARLPKATDLLGSDPEFTGSESTDEYINRTRGRSPERTDDNASSFNNPATAEKKAARAKRKGALNDSIKEALPPLGRTGDRPLHEPNCAQPFRGSYPKPRKAKS